MRVVSNTSPLSNLAIIGRLSLLQVQFGEIWIPHAVSIELERLVHRSAQDRLRHARQEGWLKEQRLGNKDLADIVSGQLDRGEAEAIALAMEIQAEWVLMDEREGRSVARQAGLKVTGILGVLLKAKQTGRIESLRFEIEALREHARFFIKADLEAQLVKNAEE